MKRLLPICIAIAAGFVVREGLLRADVDGLAARLAGVAVALSILAFVWRRRARA